MKQLILKIIEIFTGDAVSKEAREEFQNWLVEPGFEAEKENALLQLWDKTEATADESTYDSLLAFKRKINKDKKQKTPNTAVWKYAAAIVFMLSMTATTYMLLNRSGSENVLVECLSGNSAKTFVLPDGTEVLANSRTMLMYASDYNKTTRTVYLIGEANFKVKENAEIPFIVKSKDFSVTALGTEFDVISYMDDPCFKTTLISGSVVVEQRGCDTDYILKPSDQFAYNDIDGSYRVARIDLWDETAWQRGELVFRGAPIEDVLYNLERRFNVSFQYKTRPVNNDKYNFRFREESSLKEILDIINTVDSNLSFELQSDNSISVRIMRQS